ncbi:unnamed protein product [Zymoseptoria tritici ST99CH_1E4]|nr:unnamed protein product [Zymoseptoria tritici ST99CH_1E4]
MGKPPQVVIYERGSEASNARSDGYSIGIRSGKLIGGKQALQHMGLWSQILDDSITRDSDEHGYSGLWSLDWRRFAKLRRASCKNGPQVSLRIARVKLREQLLNAAQQGAEVVWEVSCISAVPTSEGRTRVVLSDGSEEECDVLVVADGANSRIRACIRPDDCLNFAGPVSIAAVSNFPGPLPKPVSRDWGIVPSGSGVALFASSMGEGTANWSLSYLSEAPREECRQPLTPEASAKLLQEAAERGKPFQEPFQTLLKNSDKDTVMVFNAMDKQPFAHGIANGVPTGIIFIGDSNHAVSPFAGSGANLALQDGWDLAECLCTYAMLEKAVAAYDARSMPRASVSLRKSHTSIKITHSSGLEWAVWECLLLGMGKALSLRYKCEDVFASLHEVFMRLPAHAIRHLRLRSVPIGCRYIQSGEVHPHDMKKPLRFPDPSDRVWRRSSQSENSMQ